MPKISIITINLNNRKGLHKTIESVLNQTFQDYEYIIIDGGSNDGSVEVINEFEGKITYWVSEPDKGIYNAMNKGILKAKGEYILFLNSGDWLIDHKVLHDVFSINHHDVSILYGDYLMIDQKGKTALVSFKKTTINLQFLFESSLGHPSTFIKSQLFKNELYDEKLSIVSDWKFFLKNIVFDSCSILYIDRIISCFSLDGISSYPGSKEKIENERMIVLNSMFSEHIINALRELTEIKTNILIIKMLEINKYMFLRFIFLNTARILIKFIGKVATIKK